MPDRDTIVAAPELDTTQDFADAVALGLSDRPRWLPARFLYDERGSELFEQITRLEEYYPTRSEAGILGASAGRIAGITGPVTLVELGSGSSVKTDHLLRAYARNDTPVTYVPVDVSSSILKVAANAISDRHPSVSVQGINGTYESAFPQISDLSPAMLIFLGSTIGNMNTTEGFAFWESVRDAVPAGDFFLLGADLVKDVHTLIRAYDDSEGITAAFTKNVFARMNRELGSDIDVDNIRHVVRWNESWKRIEISARFETDQQVLIEPLGRTFDIPAGEEIMTEIARKFELDALSDYAHCMGFSTEAVFTDDRRWFALLLFQKQ